MSTRAKALAVAALALVAVVVAVVISQGSRVDATPSEPGAASEALAGVPQDGFSVGDPDAPVAMVEFGDLQCPFCAEAATETIPKLISEYVAPGDLRITFEPLAFIGEDSVEAAEMAAAAALQDRGFAFVEAFYEQQGTENSGYVDDEFLTEVGDQVEGLDVEQALEDRSSSEVAELLTASADAADAAGVDSTPTFLIGTGEDDLEPLEAAPGDVDSFRAEIDSRLGG
jgi:protein-disulfide isomerase